MFLDQIIHYARLELQEECDYTKEAEKQLKMRGLVQNDKRYYVPNVLEDLSTSRILTLEFVKGVGDFQ